MPTQIQPNQSATTNATASDGTQLNPTALTLAKSIRAQEVGIHPTQMPSAQDYTKMGDSGKSTGIAQWLNGDSMADAQPLKPGQIPINFQNDAKKYGLDPNDFSPKNQDKVLYARIEGQLKQGLAPSEIVAKQNGAKIVNGKYVAINPEYAAAVENNYKLLSQQGASPQQGGFVNPAQAAAGNGSFIQPPAQQTPPTQTEGQQPTPSGGGFLNTLGALGKGAANLVLGPAESLGTHLAQVTAPGIAAALDATGITHGEVDKVRQREQQTQTTLTGGQVAPITGAGDAAEKIAGDVAQLGAYFVPGAGMLGAAGTGALMGAGSAMSQGGDLANVATSGLLGTALGAGAAGATKLAGAGIQKIGDTLSGETASKAVQGIKDAYASALNLNASERGLENRSGKDLAQVLTDNHVPLGRNEDGTLDASKAIPMLQEKLAPLNQQANQILSNPQGVVGHVNLAKIQTAVHDAIDGMTIPEVDKASAKEEASKYLSAEAKKYGTNLTPADADKIKQGFWGATFDRNRSNLQNHIPYMLGKQMQTATEKAVQGTDTEVDLHTLNAQRGDLIDAIRRLQKMDGVKLLKGGRLGNMMSGVVGSIAGAASGLGPLGTIGGDYFGNKASQFLQDPATKIAIAEAKAKAAGAVPGVLGKAAAPVGKAINATGGVVKKGARAAGLLTNLVAK